MEPVTNIKKTERNWYILTTFSLEPLSFIISLLQGGNKTTCKFFMWVNNQESGRVTFHAHK